MVILFVILMLAAAGLWAGLAAGSLSLHDSDPAGNALGQAYTAMMGIALWVLLAVLLLMAGSAGRMPSWTVAVALVLTPASGVAVQMALARMGRDRTCKWPAALTIAMPGLLMAFAVVCFFPVLADALPLNGLGAAVWGALAVLTALPWLAGGKEPRRRAALPQTPAERALEETRRREEAEQQNRDRFHALNSDSPFRDWWEFTADGSAFRLAALEGARRAPSRQQDVIAMLPAGRRRLFLALPDLDLDATPELHQAAREFLDDQVKNLMPFNPAKPQPATFVTEWLEDYFPVIRWLAARQGNFDAQLAAMEKAVLQYPDSMERQLFIAQLRSLEIAGLNSAP